MKLKNPFKNIPTHMDYEGQKLVSVFRKGFQFFACLEFSANIVSSEEEKANGVE